MSEIKIDAAALDERPNGEIVLRGVVAPESLHLLRVDAYQRDAFDREDIFQGLMQGSTPPDIDLGMRGQRFRSEGSAFFLQDPVFIIDGWQRVHNLRRFLVMHPEKGRNIRLGAEIHFGTDFASEKERFETLNANRYRVATSKLLSNRRDSSPALLTLYGLSHTDKDFALYQRVSWDQKLGKGELVTATLYVRSILNLHGHLVGRNFNGIGKTVRALDNLVKVVPLQTFRGNAKGFFELLDYAFPLSNIVHRVAAPQIRGSFVNALAQLVSDHTNFWRDPGGRVLDVPNDYRNKLSTLKINDPEIVRLSKSSGAAQVILYEMMRRHINSGRRLSHLIPRPLAKVFEATGGQSLRAARRALDEATLAAIAEEE